MPTPRLELVNTVLLSVVTALVIALIIVLIVILTKPAKSSSKQTLKDGFLSTAQFSAVDNRTDVVTPKDFVDKILTGTHILEISPFERQLTEGKASDWSQAGTETEGEPNKKYDAVISHKVIETKPNLVKHLQHVSTLLSKGGKYYVIVPDHRYDMTHFMTPSSLAQVIKAHLENKTTLPSKALFEHTALVTHNDAQRHWRGDHGNPTENRAARIKNAEKDLKSKGTQAATASVRAWHFTPHSFAQLMKDLFDAGHNPLTLEKIILTPNNQSEFFAVLTKA